MKKSSYQRGFFCGLSRVEEKLHIQAAILLLMNSEKNFFLFEDNPQQATIDWLITHLKDISQHLVVNDIFRDTHLRKILDKLGQDQVFAYFVATTKFWNSIVEERKKRNTGVTDGLFGEEITTQQISHADGTDRTQESGYKVNLEYLERIGIDPDKVLYFRLTQPSDGIEAKPELYWTSDYFETIKGLQAEIPETQRKTAVILISSLAEIAKNGGIIQDGNDDLGLAIRQVGNENFDQSKSLGIIQF